MADISGKRIAILVHNYFEQAELTGPKAALEAAGATTTLLTVSGEDTVQGLNHVDLADSFTVDGQLEDASADDFDALLLPGGATNADNLRMEERAKDWVKEFLEEDKPVAIICHAPWILASAGLADGRAMTSFATIQDDLRNAGADWSDDEVVIDGSLITSRDPDDIPAFSNALIEMLADQK